MSRAAITIARREMRNALRERTIVTALIIQLFVAGFSSVLGTGLAALLDPEALPATGRPHLALYGDNAMKNQLEADGLTVVEVAEPGDALALLNAGTVDGAILRLSPEDDDAVRLHLLLPEGELEATLTLVQVKAALTNYERDLRQQRQARLSYEPTYLETNAHPGAYALIHTVLIPLLVLLPVVLAGALVADGLVEEIQRGTLPVLLSAPVRLKDVARGKMLGNVLPVPVLAVTWLGLLQLNGYTVTPQAAAEVAAFATAAAVLLAVPGAILALRYPDRGQVQLLYAGLMLPILLATMLLPTPVGNALALLTAGSATIGAHALVAGTGATAVIAWALLERYLRGSLPPA